MPSMRILTARQMREADRRTIEELGVPSLVLMENAGREVASAVERAFPDLVGRRVAILCGRGNNGGDGFVVARLLHQRGVDVSVFLVGRDVGREGRRARRTSRESRPWTCRSPRSAGSSSGSASPPEFARHTLVVDALFGTGLSAPLSGLLAEIVEDDQRRRRARSCRLTCPAGCRRTRTR